MVFFGELHMHQGCATVNTGAVLLRANEPVDMPVNHATRIAYHTYNDQ